MFLPANKRIDDLVLLFQKRDRNSKRAAGG
jgi:hypothetical protein